VANFAEDTSPVAVSGRGDFPPDSMIDVPETLELKYTFANGVVMEVDTSGVAIRFEGTEGWIACQKWRGQLEASDLSVFRRVYDPTTSKLPPRRPREHRDFLDSIKSGRPPMYTAEGLHRLCTTLHLGAIALEVGRPLRWDPQTESFDDPAANARRSRPRRDDWKKLPPR
jgi:hypothetical protein